MAKRKLKLLLNIGFDDQKKYGIPDGATEGMPPMENEVISIDEDKAEILVNVLKIAKDYDAKEERAHEEVVREADAANVTSEVASRLAREQAEKDAEKKLKGK